MIIYCGKVNKKAYYIREADINVYSIQELAYFIMNFAVLISNDFVSKKLLYFILKDLQMEDLYNELNMLYNQKDTKIFDMLECILKHSNYYTDTDIKWFISDLYVLLRLNKNEYINLAGDKLFGLKKYEMAISQYKMIVDDDYTILKKLGFCYAKLQLFDKASDYLVEYFAKTSDLTILKYLYFCFKLDKNTEQFTKYKNLINENEVVNYEIDIVTRMVNSKECEEVKQIENVFLMGEKYIKENIKTFLNKWKERYRNIG